MYRERKPKNPWTTGYRYPNRKDRIAFYPLPRLERQSRVPGFGAGKTVEFRTVGQNAAIQKAMRQPTRGVRAVSWLLLVSVPLLLIGWAASVIVPIYLETERAVDQIFVTQVARQSFVTPAAPQVAGVETATPEPTATATLTPTAAASGTVVAVVDPTATPSPEPTIAATPLPAWDGRDLINILLLGVDARESDSSPPRSDTMIIVQIDPVARRVDMLSIPRDLLVEIPGYSSTKVNAAYPYGAANPNIPGGGPTLAAQTIEHNFQIPIHYFAEVDIKGLQTVIDTIGGITIDVPAFVKDEQFPFEDYGYTRIYFQPGLQHLDGEMAVRYARTRHADGDFMRQQRQQDVLIAMRDQALVTGLITKLPEIISQIGDSVRTDLLGDDPSFRKLYALARLGQEIGRENIHSHSLAGLVTEQIINEGYYLVADWSAVQRLAQNLPGDTGERDYSPTFPAPQATPIPTAEPDLIATPEPDIVVPENGEAPPVNDEAVEAIP